MIKFPLDFIMKAPGIGAWWRRIKCQRHGGHVFPRERRPEEWECEVKCQQCDDTYVYSDVPPLTDREPPPKAPQPRPPKCEINMNAKQLEDLLLRLRILTDEAQRLADLHNLGNAPGWVMRDQRYELAITLREATEVVQEIVVAKRREAPTS